MQHVEIYTPGYTGNAVSFMSRRTLESHGNFFKPYLEPGLSVLDCGCGPGSISAGIAAEVFPAMVIGVDFSELQVEAAIRHGQSIENLRFQQASVYSLPFPDGSFDRVFSHALIEHLSKPVTALEELRRVIKPGGYLGLCSPHWPAFVLTPPSADVLHVMARYAELQRANGGDPAAGARLGDYVSSAGFNDIRMAARFECYEPVTLISEYLAQRLELADQGDLAATLRRWSDNPAAMFAQAWIAVTARKAG